MQVFGADNQRRRMSPDLISRCTISTISGVFTQLALLSIPNFFGDFSLIVQLLISVVVLLVAMIFGQFVRRVLGVRASAPAFVVFHMIFIWCVYIGVIREAASPLISILFNGIFALLLTGFFRMLVSDPGFVRCDLPSFVNVSVSEDSSHLKDLPSSEAENCLQNSTEEVSLSAKRVRYCKSCRAHIQGFDHHCPAFGNCIGQKNHALFMVLLVGFLLTEALYTLTAYKWMEKNEIHQASNTMIAQNLAISTMIFSLVQVIWKLPFFIWHVYCVCFNMRTDEWINWRRYPEFHVIVQQSTPSSEIRFRNPYHGGIVSNVKGFLRM